MKLELVGGEGEGMNRKRARTGEKKTAWDSKKENTRGCCSENRPKRGTAGGSDVQSETRVMRGFRRDALVGGVGEIQRSILNT